MKSSISPPLISLAVKQEQNLLGFLKHSAILTEVHQVQNINNEMQQRTYLIGKHISSSLDGHNMGVIGKYSKQNWTVVLA